MKILHTSDWHLGRTLYGRKRYDEFESFLQWLQHTIASETIDILLIAGDIFDTNTPSNKAQALYYQFLSNIAGSSCRHVVVIAGNHDSPSFLTAPKELLQYLNVHVVGSIAEDIEQEVVILQNNDVPEAIICAVPYLRDKDIRRAEAGETIDEKNAKLIQGVRHHYAKVCELADKKRQVCLDKHDIDLPIIGMGHLFTAGGKTMEGDGVRELYVGSLAHVGADIFPEILDYVALGHLHVPQRVAKKDHIRYSGSPIPMGFGEAKQQKVILMIEFNGKQPSIVEKPIPCFQTLIQIAGSITDIHETLHHLKQDNSKAFLEIDLLGSDMIHDVNKRLNDEISGSNMEILRIRNKQQLERILQPLTIEETLDDLDVQDVFMRCIDNDEYSKINRKELLGCYMEILQAIEESDAHAE